MNMEGNAPVSNRPVLTDEHGGGFDSQLVYVRVMEFIDDAVLHDARSFDPDVWRQVVELFDAILQEQLSTRRPVQERRESARDGAALGSGAPYRGNAASSTRATCSG